MPSKRSISVRISSSLDALDGDRCQQLRLALRLGGRQLANAGDARQVYSADLVVGVLHHVGRPDREGVLPVLAAHCQQSTGRDEAAMTGLAREAGRNLVRRLVDTAEPDQIVRAALAAKEIVGAAHDEAVPDRRRFLVTIGQIVNARSLEHGLPVVRQQYAGSADRGGRAVCVVEDAQARRKATPGGGARGP